MSKIRDAFLNAAIPSEIVDVTIEGVDLKVEIRQRTVRQQYDLIEKVTKPDGTLNGMMLAVETVIACAFDPETGNPVFEAADRDPLLNVPSDVFQTLLAAANRASGVEDQDEVVARLDETPADAPSTG